MYSTYSGLLVEMGLPQIDEFAECTISLKSKKFVQCCFNITTIFIKSVIGVRQQLPVVLCKTSAIYVQ